jgi:hypothetical protein
MCATPGSPTLPSRSPRRRQPHPLVTVLGGGLVEEHPTLLDPTDRVCVDLWPLAQTLPPDRWRGAGAVPLRCPRYPRPAHDRRAVWPRVPRGGRAHGARLGHDARSLGDRSPSTDEADPGGCTRRQDHDRPNALLWRDEVLADLKRWLRQTSGAAPFDEPTRGRVPSVPSLCKMTPRNSMGTVEVPQQSGASLSIRKNYPDKKSPLVGMDSSALTLLNRWQPYTPAASTHPRHRPLLPTGPSPAAENAA